MSAEHVAVSPQAEVAPPRFLALGLVAIGLGLPPVALPVSAVLRPLFAREATFGELRTRTRTRIGRH